MTLSQQSEGGQTDGRGRRGGTGARASESKYSVQGAAGGRRLVLRLTGPIRPERAGKPSEAVFYQEPLTLDVRGHCEHQGRLAGQERRILADPTLRSHCVHPPNLRTQTNAPLLKEKKKRMNSHAACPRRLFWVAQL